MEVSKPDSLPPHRIYSLVVQPYVVASALIGKV